MMYFKRDREQVEYFLDQHLKFHYWHRVQLKDIWELYQRWCLAKEVEPRLQRKDLVKWMESPQLGWQRLERSDAMVKYHGVFLVDADKAGYPPLPEKEPKKLRTPEEIAESKKRWHAMRQEAQKRRLVPDVILEEAAKRQVDTTPPVKKSKFLRKLLGDENWRKQQEDTK